MSKLLFVILFAPALLSEQVFGQKEFHTNGSKLQSHFYAPFVLFCVTMFFVYERRTKTVFKNSDILIYSETILNYFMQVAKTTLALIKVTVCVIRLLYCTLFHLLFTASGQPCGKRRYHCMSTAVCHPRRCTCGCKAPQTGDGRLGCFRPGDAAIFLHPDAYIKTFNGDSFKMATPCRYKVLHYTVASRNGFIASAEVYAKNTLHKGEIYFVNNILVTISVMAGTKIGKHSILLEGTAQSGQYKFMTTVLEDTMPLSEKVPLDFSKYIISLAVDFVDNFIVARIDGVGLTIRLRSPASEDEEVQNMIPGATMVIDREVVPYISFINGTLSSFPRGPSFTSEAKSLDLDLGLYAYYLAILNTPAIIMDDEICKETAIVFNNICSDVKTRATLLETCTSIYSDRKFLSCLYEKYLVEGINMEHRLFFRYCAQSFCLHGVDICEIMIHSIEETQCELPEKLTGFRCPENFSTIV